MGTINRVFLVGRLGTDPEMRYTPQGTAVCTLSVATDRWVRRDAPEEERKADWHRVKAWDKLAELCHRYLRKGRQVAVVGSVRYDQWTGQDGTKKYSTEIRASDVTFLDSKDVEGGASHRGYGYGGAPAQPRAKPDGGPLRPLVSATAAPAMGAGDDLPF